MKIFFLGLAFLLWAARRLSPGLNTFLNKLLATDDVDHTQEITGSASMRSGWFLMGLVFVGLSLTVLENMKPSLYFTQDDVRIGEMPGTLLGCQALLHGQLPVYDPYTCMGAPFAGTGLYSLSYPPTLIAYLFARFVLHNPYLMMEVFAILHIYVGYIVTYLLACRLRMKALPATLAALSFVLSGTTLVMGRGWHYFMTIIVFMPLFLWAAVILVEQKVTWRWTLWTGVAIGMYYQVGFTQIWIYAITLFCTSLFVLCLTKSVPIRRCLQAVPALLIGLGLALPLALQQLHLTRGINRGYGYGHGITQGLRAMVLPYPLTKAEHPDHWGSMGIQYMGSFYFFGGLFAVLLLGSVILLISSRPARRLLADQSWTILALIVFAFCIGSPGPWNLLLKMPVIKHISNYPYRLMQFFVLFAVLSGGVLLERILRITPRRRVVECILGTAALGILLYHVSLCRTASATFTFMAYPTLPPTMRDALLPSDSRMQERTCAYATEVSEDPDYAYTLNQAIADVYHIPGFNGQSPVSQYSPEYTSVFSKLFASPVEATRAYGLRWHLIEPPIRAGNPNLPPTLRDETHYQWAWTGPLTGKSLITQINPQNFPVAFTVGDVTVRRLDDVDPLAFPIADRRHPLPIKMDCTGIDVDISSVQTQGAILVNFLWFAEMHGYVDGTEVKCRQDDWGRIEVIAPSNAKKLSIRYQPDWRTGILLGILFTLLGIVAQFVSGTHTDARPVVFD